MSDTIKLEQWPVQSQLTHHKFKGDKTGDTCAADMKQISIWLANKAGNKNQETNNWNNNLFKIRKANALRLSKQDSTGGPCAADVEKIIIWLANDKVKEKTEIMTCSKSTDNASGSCKRNNNGGVY